MASDNHRAPVPTPAEVERITALEDGVVRNLQITQCYHELCLAFTARTGLSANWCTFATWASKQAGQSIRKEDLRRTLESLKDSLPFVEQAAEQIAEFAKKAGRKQDKNVILVKIWELLDPAGAIERSSQAVGTGNRKVFAEIGREFARFYAACLEDAHFDAEKIARFCDELRPGDPPDGQRYLRQAFERYYQAMFEADGKQRAELLLLANIEIGFHEQTRLQPEIAGALEAAVDDPDQLTERLVQAVFGGWSWYIQSLLFFIRLVKGQALLDKVVHRLAADVRSQMRPLLTNLMMSIGLPHGQRIRLGEDLSAGFPATLQHITHPDLQALLQRVDPTPDSLTGSGALDWADLPDRLHFIVDLFRCYQETPDLFLPPFSEEQAAEIKAGRLPAGAL